MKLSSPPLGASFPTLLLSAALALSPTAVSSQATQLEEGSTVAGTLAEGDTVRYTVEVGEDYYVFGEVDQISVDVVVRVLDPEGDQLGRFDGPGRGSNRFSGTPDDPGTYTLQVIPDEGQTGDYELTLHRVEPLEDDPADRTDQLMTRYDGNDYPGGAIRVWRDGRTLFSNAYGMANLTYGIPFETDMPTNIGSTSKQFTAFAVMLQADRGELSLDDDIRKHIPELPEFDETVTVRHLITHTSGLREFLNLLVMAGRRMDRGDWIDRSELIDIVQRQPALQNEPGAEWNYNNTAFGLAALIVERTSGQDFHDFMRENVFLPLGMTRTMVRPSPLHPVPGKSEGYTPGPDGFLEVGDLGGAVGAGGIYASVEDLERWIQNYANPTVGSREIFDEMMTSYVLTDGEETGYGYGLSIDEHRGLERVHHGGADVAHRSMLVYYPEINAGITAQGNYGEFNSGIAFDLAEVWFADAMEPEEEAVVADGEGFDPESYDPEAFDELAGRYALDANRDFVLTFSREGETLYTEATGQPQFEIVPTSDSTFELSGVPASVTFQRNDEGEVDGVLLHQGGQSQHASRLTDEAAEPWEPTAEALEAFRGRYFSPELETFYDIALDDGELVVHHRRRDDATLTPGNEDTFTGGGLTYSFERDRNGQVIAFYASNGRTRDVRFERVLR